MRRNVEAFVKRRKRRLLQWQYLLVAGSQWRAAPRLFATRPSLPAMTSETNGSMLIRKPPDWRQPSWRRSMVGKRTGYRIWHAEH